MAAFPPAEPDRGYQQRFKPLGLLDGASPYQDAPPDLARALTDGLATGRSKLEAFTRTGTVQKVNGWMMGLHMFDYNLDFFGPGTIDDPQWKKPDRASAYPERALAARLACGATTPTKPPTRRSSRTTKASSSPAAAVTASASASCPPSAPSGH